MFQVEVSFVGNCVDCNQRYESHKFQSVPYSALVVEKNLPLILKTISNKWVYELCDTDEMCKKCNRVYAVLTMEDGEVRFLKNIRRIASIIEFDPFKALHEATHTMSLDLMKNILDKGDFANSMYNGCTPLHVAAERNFVEGVELLLEYGANPQAKSDILLSPYDIAEKHRFKDLIIMFDEHMMRIAEKMRGNPNSF
ncbi:MAG: ankyrin repeat domain-containing protein [Parachlamydiaceae bacterium]